MSTGDVRYDALLAMGLFLALAGILMLAANWYARKRHAEMLARLAFRHRQQKNDAAEDSIWRAPLTALVEFPRRPMLGADDPREVTVPIRPFEAERERILRERRQKGRIH